MNELVDRLGWTLVHSLWQFSLIVFIAILVDRIVRVGAVGRYRIYCTALLCCLITSVATWCWLPKVSATDTALLPDSLSQVSITATSIDDGNRATGAAEIIETGARARSRQTKRLRWTR